MAIKKSDVVKKVTVEMAEDVLAAETIINAKLANFIDGGHVIINYSDLNLRYPDNYAYCNRLIQELINRYRRAEWNVSSHSDQREGSWLDFS